jgi:hypothetical protein
MATLSVQNPTLLDLAKVTDPDGSIAAVVEILNETNEVLADMSWMEGNLPTGHPDMAQTVRRCAAQQVNECSGDR